MIAMVQMYQIIYKVEWSNGCSPKIGIAGLKYSWFERRG